MKKLFTPVLTLLLASGGMVSAQHTYDFTKWSEATIANLKADAAAGASSGWSDDEKNDGNTVEGCFWMAGDNAAVGTDGNLTANGDVIEELRGLDFTTAPATRNLAIAVNYPTTSLGTYAGPSYLWLGGSKKDYFVIHDVTPGLYIHMGVETHKTSDARGVELYVYANGAKGDKLTGANGETVAPPTAYADQTWLVPEGTEPVDIMVYNTNGCHLYYIDINENVETTGITEIETSENVEPVYYNLQGVRVDNPTKGIHVRVRGNKVDKVIVR
ncbi:MAG: hypothetical protein J1F43_03425 [Muribaculaceae bacterium]|nr:hypothetical protein [Muribaculaceae bacterium]